MALLSAIGLMEATVFGLTHLFHAQLQQSGRQRRPLSAPWELS